MTRLAVEGADVRLECAHCGAHRVLGAWAYSWAIRSGTPVSCPTCLESEVPDGSANPVPLAHPAPRFVRSAAGRSLGA